MQNPPFLPSCGTGRSQFEPARHLLLKNFGGVIFLGDATQLLKVGRAVAAQGILRFVRVIEIDVFVVFVDAFGILGQLVDDALADLSEQSVVLGILPGEVGLKYYAHGVSD